MLVSWTCFRIIHASSCFPFWRREKQHKFTCESGLVLSHLENKSSAGRVTGFQKVPWASSHCHLVIPTFFTGGSAGTPPNDTPTPPCPPPEGHCCCVSSKYTTQNDLGILRYGCKYVCAQICKMKWNVSRYFSGNGNIHKTQNQSSDMSHYKVKH